MHDKTLEADRVAVVTAMRTFAPLFTLMQWPFDAVDVEAGLLDACAELRADRTMTFRGSGRFIVLPPEPDDDSAPCVIALQSFEHVF
jgi:hypothetical protein